MQGYLLLRNNRETGPFTLEEITAQALSPTDLIWIEGHSTAWKYPTEVEALYPYLSATNEKRDSGMGSVIHTSRVIFVALPQKVTRQPFTTVTIGGKQQGFVELKTHYKPANKTLEENDQLPEKQQPYLNRNTFSKVHSGLWIGCVFSGLFFSTILINDIVETLDITNAARAIAALPAIDRENSTEILEEHFYQNALTTEIIPVDTVTMQPVTREPAKVNLKKLVHLETNDYQVGLLGGIRNLRMLVINKSFATLDKVKFELQYLKPNGQVLKTEKLTIKSVGPKSRKSLAVPAHSRGVNVRYRIIDIQSKQNTPVLVNV